MSGGSGRTGAARRSEGGEPANARNCRRKASVSTRRQNALASSDDEDDNDFDELQLGKHNPESLRRARRRVVWSNFKSHYGFIAVLTMFSPFLALIYTGDKPTGNVREEFAKRNLYVDCLIILDSPPFAKK